MTREPVMPFGRFRGVALRDIADNAYLEWAAGVATTAWLKIAIEEELSRRYEEAKWARQEREREAAVAAALPEPRDVNPTIALELVKAGYRDLVRRYHPDVVGGDGETMKAVTSTTRWLKRVIEHLSPNGNGHG